MHEFSELAYRSSTFTRELLNELQSKIIIELDDNAPTNSITNLRAIRLSKIVFAIGIFSFFESTLQEKLRVKNGFKYLQNLLQERDEHELLKEFHYVKLAVNALKHGNGESYKTLIRKEIGILNAKVKGIGENYFNEGDVSEIVALIDVDDVFINQIVELIKKLEDFIN